MITEKKAITKSDQKIMNALKASLQWLRNAKNKNTISKTGGLTVYGCEQRNVKVFYEMLNTDKRKLTGWERELYFSI